MMALAVCSRMAGLPPVQRMADVVAVDIENSKGAVAGFIPMNRLVVVGKLRPSGGFTSFGVDFHCCHDSILHN